MNKYHGQSTTVLRPRTVQEVSEIVKHCNERGIGIVPQGGNTGLVGGGVPLKDELILSLGNMNKVRSFDPVSGESFIGPRIEDDFTDWSDYISHRNSCGRRRLHFGVLVRVPCTSPPYCTARSRSEGKVSISDYITVRASSCTPVSVVKSGVTYQQTQVAYDCSGMARSMVQFLVWRLFFQMELS